MEEYNREARERANMGEVRRGREREEQREETERE